MRGTSQIRFLPHGGGRLAYEVRGHGPPLVVPAWWVSHLDLDRRSEDQRRFWDAVAEDYTLVRYDRLGVGMSDRSPGGAKLTVDGDVGTLRALVDELGFDRVALLGGSSGSATAVAFGAAFPERVSRMVLYGSYAHGADIAPPEVSDAIVAAVHAHWGLGSRLLGDLFLGDAGPSERAHFTAVQREAATAETAAALLRLVYAVDVRGHLPRVRCPTVVVHRRDDRAMPYRLGREVAAAIPGATFVPLRGSAHFPWHGDAESVIRAIRDALAPAPATPDAAEPAPALLSTREVQVIACVARGLNDREIAEQLVLSAHTVHRHVANIRRKLGRTSRTAAVAEAARLGLL